MSNRDHEGRRRSGVWLPDQCWDWLDETARRDGTSRSDLLEGLVLLAMDGEGSPAAVKHTASEVKGLTITIHEPTARHDDFGAGVRRGYAEGIRDGRSGR